MNEAWLTTIEQFLSASNSIEFSAAGDNGERYGHISRVLTRFDYPGRNKRERSVLRCAALVFERFNGRKELYSGFGSGHSLVWRFDKPVNGSTSHRADARTRDADVQRHA
jgi:hypothetical protein